MEWVKEFYHKQYEWMSMDDDEAIKYQEGSIRKMEGLSEKPVHNILELGGGKGHFAVAAAERGYKVTVIELVEEAARYIRQLAAERNVQDHLRIINGDFYTLELEEEFDAVCYWDGFGIGTDRDQERLLTRIENWLKQDGTAFIDVYTPWYWAKVAGKELNISESVTRRYDFNAEQCRMLDAWRNKMDSAGQVTQSLRCYSPADLRLLLRDRNLYLVLCEPGGEMDYDNWEFHEQVPLNTAMTFLAKLNKS